MSRLEELISELCPDGVEYKRFGNICDYIRGVTYSKSQEAKPSDFDSWMILRANNITLSNNVLNYDDVKTVKKEVRIKPEQFLKAKDILICAGSGSKEHIGKVAYIYEDMVYSFGGFMAVIRTSESLNSRFLFHILTGRSFKSYLSFALNSTTINNLNASVMADFYIPVPPLPVQQEIVRILDHFTELTAELQKKLEVEHALRKKQYEFYRDLLLFSDKNCEMKTILEVADSYTGLTYKPSDTASNGTLVLRSSNIRDSRLCFENNVFVQMNNIPSRAIAHENDILVCVRNGSRALIGKAALIPRTEKTMAFGAFMTVLRAKPIIIDYRYLFHVWQSPRIQSVMHGDDAMPINQITSRELSRVKIPVPSLTRQNKIVDFLDKYEFLGFDLNSCLPAEIAARQKQYEYYRDKLLTFKELKKS